MKLTLQHVAIRSTDSLDSWIERHIFALSRLRQIDEAVVRLTHRRDASPAFQVRVHLVTPGPDFVVEDRDHTLRAAITRVMRELSGQIAGRERRRLRRITSKVSAPATRLRPTNSFRTNN